jgi:hypothetical protein
LLTPHIRLIECRNGVVCDDREINCLLILGVRDVPNLEGHPKPGPRHTPELSRKIMSKSISDPASRYRSWACSAIKMKTHVAAVASLGNPGVSV